MDINCILIDDEVKALTSLTYDLKQFEDRIRILSTFTRAKDALKFLEDNRVDVIFLDVEMPTMDGFSFLDKVKENHEFEVVFTTAYNKYAIDAIRKEALDYLVKPIDPIELEKTISRIEKSILKHKETQKSEQLLEYIEGSQDLPKRIKLAYDRKIVFLEPEEILFCESEGNYCRIFLENGKEIFFTQKLKQLEEAFPKNHFYRVHNSYLVNLSKVKEFHKNEGYLVINNDTRVPVSRQKRNEVLERL